MQLNLLKNQLGVTLIEILVAMAVGILLLGAAASVGFSTLSVSKDSIANNNAQYELQNAMNIVTKELRRAGYTATEEVSQTATGFRNIRFFGGSGNANHNCAVFRYDREANADPLLPPGNGAVNAGDIRGLRLDANKLQMLTGATSTAIAASCAGAGTWEAITGSGLTITTFGLTYTPIMLMDGSRVVEQVVVTLSGTAKNGNTHTLTEVIQLRNRPFVN